MAASERATRRNEVATAVVLFLATFSACNASSEDERGSLGEPPAAIAYCEGLGYTLTDSLCQFPDGTACEPWSFYYALCGETHSYCHLHGGQISSESQDMGTWTAVVAVCQIDGKRCLEDPLWRTGECKPPDADGG